MYKFKPKLSNDLIKFIAVPTTNYLQDGILKLIVSLAGLTKYKAETFALDYASARLFQ